MPLSSPTTHAGPLRPRAAADPKDMTLKATEHPQSGDSLSKDHENAPHQHENTLTNSSKSTQALIPRKDDSASEEGDNERPVREKLKKTSINTLPKQSVTEEEGQESPLVTDSKETVLEQDLHDSSGTNALIASEQSKESEDRGRHSRKRSYDDLTSSDLLGDSVSQTIKGDELTERDVSPRKRNRESLNPDEVSLINSRATNERDDNDSERAISPFSSPKGTADGAAAGEIHPKESQSHSDRLNLTPDRDEKMGEARVLSPKKKRSRDQFDKDLENPEDENTNETLQGRLSGEFENGSPAGVRGGGRTAREEPEKKRVRDLSKSQSKSDEQENTSITAVSLKRSIELQARVINFRTLESPRT